MSPIEKELMAAWAMIDALRAQNKELREQAASASAALRSTQMSNAVLREADKVQEKPELQPLSLHELENIFRRHSKQGSSFKEVIGDLSRALAIKNGYQYKGE